MLTPLIAIGLGTLAALRPGGRLDGAISGGTLFSYSMPDFVVGNVFIIVFALWLGIAPAVLMISESAPAAQVLAVSVLPVMALIVSGVAYQFRLLRAACSTRATASSSSAPACRGCRNGALSSCTRFPSR